MPPDRDRGQSDLLTGLKGLGVVRWQEVLLCVPKTYLDYSGITPISMAIPQEDAAPVRHLFRLVVSEVAGFVQQPKKRIVLSATDGVFTVKLVSFNLADAAAWKALGLGDVIYVHGVLQKWNESLQITGPQIIPGSLIGRVVPVYEKKRGVVSEGAIYDASRYALDHLPKETVDYLVSCYHGMTETEILARTRLKAPSLEAILRATHNPFSVDEGYRGIAAMKRLAALSIVEKAKHLKLRTAVPESVVTIPKEMVDELAGKLPYALTEDQRTAIDDIVSDMASPVPMRRVLSGDVGSGKTVCLLIPALATQRLGRFAVILTPNALLADQMQKECKEFFGEDSNILAVTASTGKIDLSSNPILVGTTALLFRLKGGPPPALFAIDEQQKYSVSQKAALASLTSNYIEATATPIPRTTALITHGSLSVSILRQIPFEKSILTKIVDAVEGKRLFDHTRKVIESGSQACVVYPIVTSPEQAKKSVIAAYEMWNSYFPGKVAMVHGQMKEEEKLEAIRGLKRGDKQIAIVTTVIELGVTLCNLRSLVVVNADRFGTSTLHQLRGRVARHGGKGYFFLFLPEQVSTETMTRLRLLEEHADGFTLSERDAEIRGYGDLFEKAEKQSGASRSSVFFCVNLTPGDIHRVCSPQHVIAA